MLDRKSASPDRPLVLHVRCVSGYGGGPEKTILNSPRHLARLGYDAVCAYMHPPADPGWNTLRARAEEREVELLSVPDRGAWDWKVVTQLSRFCKARRVAVWHGHDYKSNALGLLLNRSCPMKLVTTVHGWVQHTWRTPLYYAIDRWCIRHYDQVICVSEDLVDECLRAGVPAARCHHIANAIDTEEFRRPEDWRSDSLGRSTDWIIGAMGRLSEEKGFDLLIRAVDQLLTEGHSLQLRIAGDGHLRPALQALVEQLGRQDHIRLLGQVSDPQSFFLELDAFVLSSLREGLPNVLLEAMALEVPVISTSVAGIPRLIANDHHGLLVEPGSRDAIVDGLRRLLNRGDRGRQWAIAARRHIEQTFSFRRRMEKIALLYDAVLAGSDQSARRDAIGRT